MGLNTPDEAYALSMAYTNKVAGSGGAKISKKDDNALTQEPDGLYVLDTRPYKQVAITVDPTTLPVGKYYTEGTLAADNTFYPVSGYKHLTFEVIGTETDATTGYKIIKLFDATGSYIKMQQGTKWENWKRLIDTVDEKYSSTSLNAQSGKAVASAISTAVGSLTFLSKEIITKAQATAFTADPTKAEFNKIYLVKDTSVKGSDKYFEYQRLGNDTASTFELTGDTSTDLTDYAKKTEVVLDSEIATSFAATTSDTKVPSEKLVKTELDKKLEKIPDDVVRKYTTNNIPYYQIANEYGNNGWHYVVDIDGVITFYNNYDQEYSCYIYVFNKQYKKDIFDDLTKVNYILSDKNVSWELSEYRPSDTWSPYYKTSGNNDKIVIPNNSNIDRITLLITVKVPANTSYSIRLQNVQTRDSNPLPYMSPFPLGYDRQVDVLVSDCKWPVTSSRLKQLNNRVINSAYSTSNTVSHSQHISMESDYMIGDFYCWIAEQSGSHRVYLSPDSEDNVYLITMGCGDDNQEILCTILYCSLWYSPFLTVLHYYGEGQVGFAYLDGRDREDFHPTNSRLTNGELVAGPCRLNNTNVSDAGNNNLIWMDLKGHDHYDYEDVRVSIVELGSLW